MNEQIKTDIPLPSKTGEVIIQNGGTPAPEHPHSLDAPFLDLLERAARDPNFDTAKLRELWALKKEEMAERKAERIRQAFNTAMVKVQAEIPQITRDAANRETNSRYARLETICKILMPIITKNGFTLSYGTVDCPKPDHTRMTCEVSHIDGYSRQYQADLPEDRLGPKGTPNKTAMHSFGSAMSYGRRYLMLLIFNVALTNEDDDGNKAGSKVADDRPINQAEAQAIRRLIVKSSSDISKFLKFMKVETVEAIPHSRLKFALDALNQKIQKMKAGKKGAK